MKVIPMPNFYQEFSGKFEITGASVISTDSKLKEAAKIFISLVENAIGSKLQQVEGQASDIVFVVDTQLSDEEYKIECSTTLLSVFASCEHGAFNAVMSLRQLLDLDILSNVDKVSMQCLNIIDKPRFAHRGLLFDVVRHFFDKDEVIRLIDLISLNKLNVLHLHLSDDQGFRLQIDKHPEINKISSYRKCTLNKVNGAEYDNVPHGGFYTKQDIAEILQYAANRHITVIPEIDLPGHMVSLISAMPQLSCTGKQKDVRCKFGISRDILCAGNPQVYTVLKDILDEVMSMFDSKIIHIGGDEAPKERWKQCPKCQQAILDNKLKDEEELQAFMVNELAKYVISNGWKVVGWNESLNDSLLPEVVCQHWTPQPKYTPTTVQHINNGRKTIISNFMYLYFDYPYAMTPLKKTYKFEPILKGVKEEAVENIIGVEGTLWTEWVSTRAKIDFNLFPRIAALAEMGWTDKKKRNYGSFLSRLKEYLPVYKALGVYYSRRAIKGLNIFGRASATLTFFNKNADIELKRQIKYDTSKK